MGSFVARLLVVAVAVPLAAQQPTFRSGVDLVAVDATVLGRDGVPIDTLGPDDFRLEVDGRVRRVVSAQFVSQTASKNLSPRLSASHFTSNEAPDAGRVVVVAVDEAHIRRLEGRQALSAAETFIDMLDPSDHIDAIGLTRLGTLALTRDRFALKRRLRPLFGQTDPVFLQFNLGLSESLEIAEGSRSRLADAVLRECGRALTEYVNLGRAADDAGGGRDACPEQLEQESRAVAQHAHTQARISLSALESLVTSLKDIPGPKTIVLLSEGMVADPRRVDMSKVSAEALAARVAIYVLQLEVPTFEAAQDRISPTLTRDLQVRADGLARVAGAARGAVFRLAGNDPRPFERIARELSGYYLLAFEPTGAERDGRAHRIKLELAGNGGIVRARIGFTLPVVPASIQARDARLVTLLRTRGVSTELPVRVTTYTYAEPGSPNLRVVVSAEAGPGRSASNVLAGFVLIDERGVIAATAAREIETGHYAFSAVVPPGRYTLRAAAIDSFGRQGSVERPFEARLTMAGGVRISDLMLAGGTAGPGEALEPLIDRVDDAMMTAYLEMHGDEGIPLPEAVRILVSPDATATLASPVTADLVRQGALIVARARVPTGALAPGRYLAVAEVIANGKAVARVSRPFTIPDR